MQKNKLQCGFGLLGICCLDCLQGPCRIDPWQKETQKGRCDANADIIVINNLLRRVATGTAIYANYGLQLVDQIRSRKIKLASPTHSILRTRLDFLPKHQLNLLAKYNVLPSNIYDAMLKALAPASTDINKLLLIGLRCALANLSVLHLIPDFMQIAVMARQPLPQWCVLEKSKIKEPLTAFSNSLIMQIRASKVFGIAFFVGCTKLSSNEVAILDEVSKNGVIPLILGCQDIATHTGIKQFGPCIDAIRVVNFINKLSSELGVDANIIPLIAIFCDQIDRRIEVMAYWMITLGIPVYWMKVPPIVGSPIVTEFFTKTVKEYFGGYFIWKKDINELIGILQERAKSSGIKPM